MRGENRSRGSYFGRLKNYFGELKNYFGRLKNYFGELKNYFGRLKNYFGELKNYFGRLKNYFGELRNYFDLLSARAGEESVIEGLQAGADDYPIKPFSAQELVTRVLAHHISRITAGKISLNLQPVELQGVIEAAIATVSCSTFKLHDLGGQDAHPTRV